MFNGDAGAGVWREAATILPPDNAWVAGGLPAMVAAALRLLRGHGFDGGVDMGEAPVGLPASVSRKALQKCSRSTCRRPTRCSSSATRARACARGSAGAVRSGGGLERRPPGLGPPLQFNPATPCPQLALARSHKSVRRTTDSAASVVAGAPAPRRNAARSLKSVVDILGVRSETIPPRLSCHPVILSHPRTAVDMCYRNPSGTGAGCTCYACFSCSIFSLPVPLERVRGIVV